MEIIEKIKTNKSIINQTEIQKICIDKLQSSPLPNPKSEILRLTNKSKFSNFLDYSVNEKDLKFDTPFPKNSQNTIRLMIGENDHIKLIENIEKFISAIDGNANFRLSLMNMIINSNKALN